MQVTGIVYVTINGIFVQSLDGATLDIGGLKADPVAVPTYGLIGFVGEILPAQLSFKTPHVKNTDIIYMREEWFGVTLSFETDTDTEYIITDAFLSEPPKLAGGNVDIKMYGNVGVQS